MFMAVHLHSQDSSCGCAVHRKGTSLQLERERRERPFLSYSCCYQLTCHSGKLKTSFLPLSFPSPGVSILLLWIDDLLPNKARMHEQDGERL